MMLMHARSLSSSSTSPASPLARGAACSVMSLICLCISPAALGQHDAPPLTPPTGSQQQADKSDQQISDEQRLLDEWKRKGITPGRVTRHDPNDPNAGQDDDPRYGLVSPLPDNGGIPPIFDEMYGPSDAELAHRAVTREYHKQLRQLKRTFFRSRLQSVREQGFAEVKEFIDPASFRPMIEEFADQDDDVRLEMLDHFARHGEQGQAALAWVALYDKDPAIRNEASMRLTPPASQPVLRILDNALRSRNHRTANAAASLAGSLNAINTIPLLIAGQATSSAADEPTGDLAWIAVQTQTAYVAGLRAIAGNNSVAFEPIMGILNEGAILRAVDAVVIAYRTEVHYNLVNMTTNDWGQSTAHLGFDTEAWWHWYQQEYLPYKNEQAYMQHLQSQAESGDNDSIFIRTIPD